MYRKMQILAVVMHEMLYNLILSHNYGQKATSELTGVLESRSTDTPVNWLGIYRKTRGGQAVEEEVLRSSTSN